MAKYIELMLTSVTELDKRIIELGKLLLAFFALYLRQQHSREKKVTTPSCVQLLYFSNIDISFYLVCSQRLHISFVF
jgi:hypothetical protein